ncbi:MAG: isocitrate/isopropylmalate dehydrogenase family protein [Candidatus Roizmanbacteria bacterium]
MNTYTICTIGGDGIGPEVIAEAKRLLQATSISFKFIEAEAGYGAYEKYGTPLPDQTVELAKSSDAVLFGAVTTPPNIKGYFSPIVRMRRVLDTYANVRPFFSLPLEGFRKNVDMIIVRENTEDLYAGREHEIEGGAISERIITVKGSTRIIEYAFELAKKKNRKKVTLIHKANVLRLTDGLFVRIGQEIAKKNPDIVYEEMLVDACAMQLIKDPTQFDIIVTTNMFGDILSDEAAALVGGLGIASSANIGSDYSLFEPVHGSAPKYVGQNKVNPMATFYASCLMLEYLGEIKTSEKIRTSILTTIEKNVLTYDLGGTTKTSDFTNAVIDQLKS